MLAIFPEPPVEPERDAWKPVVSKVVRFSVVYATTGVIGLGVLAWIEFQSRRKRRRAEQVEAAAEEQPRRMAA